MTIIAVMNHKGGVGKTTSVINISSGLARKGLKILVVDLDPQYNLTRSMSHFNIQNPNVAEVLLATVRIDDIIIPSLSPGVDLLPAGQSLSQTQIQLIPQMRADQRLKDAISMLAPNKYDIVLIDNSPSFGILINNALLAATHVLIPVEAEMLSLMGIPLLEETLNEVSRHNPGLEVLGTMISNVDKRKISTKLVIKELEALPNLLLFKNQIRTNANLSNAPGLKLDAFRLGDRKSISDYQNLIDELIDRLQTKGHLKNFIKEHHHES